MQELINFLSHHTTLTMALIIIFFLASVVEFIRANRHRSNLTAAQATQKINREQAVVLDVRSTEAYQAGHIVGAISMPAKDFLATSKKLEKYRNKPLIIVCETGVDSLKITAKLRKAGYNAYILSGGIRTWSDASMPLVKN